MAPLRKPRAYVLLAMPALAAAIFYPLLSPPDKDTAWVKAQIDSYHPITWPNGYSNPKVVIEPSGPYWIIARIWPQNGEECVAVWGVKTAMPYPKPHPGDWKEQALSCRVP